MPDNVLLDLAQIVVCFTVAWYTSISASLKFFEFLLVDMLLFNYAGLDIWFYVKCRFMQQVQKL